jgi:hypothetical protein
VLPLASRELLLARRDQLVEVPWSAGNPDLAATRLIGLANLSPFGGSMSFPLVQLVISDAHSGLRAAIDAILIGASWQRCRVHFLRITC